MKIDIDLSNWFLSSSSILEMKIFNSSCTLEKIDNLIYLNKEFNYELTCQYKLCNLIHNIDWI